MKRFGFSDLHSFKDYVGFVKLCAPNEFPQDDGVEPEEEGTVDLGFEGMRLGLRMAAEEKGRLPVFDYCGELVEEAYAHYREGRMREGFFKLEEVQKLLKKVRSQ